MFRKLIIGGALLALLLVMPVAARAQGNGKDLRIAVADPSRIFSEMQETKDLKEKMETERQRLFGMEKEKRENLTKIQKQRDELKPDHPQYEELNKQLMQAAVEFKNWGDFAKLEAERNQKRQLRSLFGKIQSAVSEIARRDGIDLVIANQQPELPQNLDQINYNQLRELINQRDVLYAGEKADISSAVIALLDSQYKGNPAGGAAQNNGGAGAGSDRGAGMALPSVGGGTGGGGTSDLPAPIDQPPAGDRSGGDGAR
jgi:Skp family chaperone for outer membrane proteins